MSREETGNTYWKYKYSGIGFIVGFTIGTLIHSVGMGIGGGVGLILGGLLGMVRDQRKTKGM